MRTITRYVLFETLKVFGLTLTILTLLMILVGLVQEAQKNGLEPRHVIQIIPYILPESLRFAIPATALFAVTNVFGRMSGSNEIVALKGLGISPMAVLGPIYGLSLALSLLTVWINDLAVTWGHPNVRRIILESVEEIAYSMLRSQRSFSPPQFSIIVKSVEDRRLIRPVITFRPRGETPGFTLTAEEAELRADTKDMLLTIVCRNGTLDVAGKTRVRFHGEEKHTIPLTTASPTGEEVLTPTFLPLADIPEAILEQQEKIERFRRHRAAKAACEILIGDFGALNGGDTRSQAEIMKYYQGHLFRLYTEPHRRWSNGFSCLSFVLLGAPLAIWWRYGDVLASFFASFMPILVVYYPVLLLGVQQAKDGTLPPESVWLGNVVIGVSSLWYLRRVIRY